METKTLKIAALLSCTIIAVNAYNAQVQAAANTDDEIQIIRVKELDNDNSLGIFNDNLSCAMHGGRFPGGFSCRFPSLAVVFENRDWRRG